MTDSNSKRSETMKRIWSDPERLARRIAAQWNPEHRKKESDRLRKFWTPERRAAHSKFMTEWHKRDKGYVR
jgi:hypothetical protein